MELHLFCQKAKKIEWKDINIPDLNHYTNKINTNTYHDYNIPDQYFQDEDAYKRASDMRVTCERKFPKTKHNNEKMLIPLCKISIKYIISI